jgi:2,5-diamino-6-(ribosylamino)-4(3H)-pyrimidinone 5'-phosphate reductase
MVEGGARVIGAFLAAAQLTHPRSIVDTIIVTVAPTFVGEDGVSYGFEEAIIPSFYLYIY